MKELLKKVKRIEIKTRRMVESTFAGEYHSAFKGQGLEFDEVRLYQMGDDIRSIDWNVTAKTGEVFIKKFREEREKTLFVLFDVSGSEEFGPAQENKLQVGTEIAAVISFSALKNNDKVGMATFTNKVEKFFPPKKGKRHVQAIIDGLLRNKTTSRNTNIKIAVDFLRKTMHRRAIIIIISDFLDSGYEKSLIHLGRKHEVILIRLVHPGEQLKTKSGIIPVYDSEGGNLVWLNSTLGKYRDDLEKKFNEIGEKLSKMDARNQVDFLTINTAGNYFSQLEQFFRKRNARKKLR